MNRQGQVVAMIVGVFALTGLGLAGVGYVVTDWATTIFLVRAQGETAVQFGPVFVALVAFMVGGLAMFVGPVLGVLLGVLFGSKQRDVLPAAGTSGVGSFVGFLFLGLLTVSGVLLGVGAGASAPFGVTGFLLKLVVAGIPTALAAAGAGALGVYLAD